MAALACMTVRNMKTGNKGGVVVLIRRVDRPLSSREDDCRSIRKVTSLSNCSNSSSRLSTTQHRPWDRRRPSMGREVVSDRVANPRIFKGSNGGAGRHFVWIWTSPRTEQGTWNDIPSSSRRCWGCKSCNSLERFGSRSLMVRPVSTLSNENPYKKWESFCTICVSHESASF